jgi:hypothetical protein
MKRCIFVLVLVAAAFGLLAAPAFAYSHRHAAVFCVRPSGGDDTAHIQKAFGRAIKAGPGSTVQLCAGHFYMNSITVDDFDGHFTGAGQGKTVIDCLRGLDPSLPGAVMPPDMWSFFIRFRGGYPRVSCMTFDITAKEPCEPWTGDNTFIDELIWVRDGASSSFDRVGFRPHVIDEAGDLNVTDDVCYSDTGGVHTMTRCSVTGLFNLRVINLSGARMTIGGGPGRGNVFDAPWNAACTDNSGSRIEFSYNRMRFSDCGVYAGQSDTAAFVEDDSVPLTPLPASRFVIRHNVMIGLTDAPWGWGGEAVFLSDQSAFAEGATDRLKAVIADNTIVVDNGGVDIPIQGAYTNSIKVLHNRISGTAMAAIGVETAPDLWGWPTATPDGLAVGSSGWQIIGNDVSGLHAVAFGDRPPAQIWLGAGASHCLVIGGCRPTTVLDEGTDNTLINVKELLWSPSAQASRQLAPFGQMKSLRLAGRQ